MFAPVVAEPVVDEELVCSGRNRTEDRRLQRIGETNSVAATSPRGKREVNLDLLDGRRTWGTAAGVGEGR